MNLTLRWLHRLLSRGAWRAKKVAAGDVFRIDAKAEDSVLSTWEDGSRARSQISALPSGVAPISRENVLRGRSRREIPSGDRFDRIAGGALWVILFVEKI